MAKKCAISNMGIEAKSNLDKELLFSESQSRAIVTLNEANLDKFLELAKEIGISAKPIGKVGGDSFKLDDISMPMDELNDIYFNTFKRVIEQDL